MTTTARMKKRMRTARATVTEGAKAAQQWQTVIKIVCIRTARQSTKVTEMTRATMTRTVELRANARSRVCNCAQSEDEEGMPAQHDHALSHV
jgi:hypothetical protein